MTLAIVRGDARALPLADLSVDLVVTSPPYWGLRDYRDGDASLAGQIGNEPTPWEYLEALWDCTREWMRVLKPTGSLWLNLGDAYNSTSRQTRVPPVGRTAQVGHTKAGMQGQSYTPDLKVKSLLGLPWRYALGCIDQLGLILRAEVIWGKPNGLPESVTDRVRRSHEHWFHFTLQPRYYSAVDEIRAPASDYARRPGVRRETPPGQRRRAMADTVNPLGALPGSVWEVATQPLNVPDHLGVDHYAAFPMEFPRRIIRGWSPPGICTACGEGRRPVVHKATLGQDNSYDRAGGRNTARPKAWLALKAANPDRIVGYACACSEPTAPVRPAVVLDPFGGTGTTALVASVLGRIGISVDRSADYCRVAQWRTTDPGERARAMQVPKPPLPPEGQPSLFEEIA